MGIGESGLYPPAPPRPRFPWTGVLASYLCTIIVWLFGSWLLFRFGDQTSDPVEQAGFGAFFLGLTILCILSIILTSLIGVLVWLKRMARAEGIK